MNDWYEKLLAECGRQHDDRCVMGAECEKRTTHILTAYVIPELRKMVDTAEHRGVPVMPGDLRPGDRVMRVHRTEGVVVERADGQLMLVDWPVHRAPGTEWLLLLDEPAAAQAEEENGMMRVYMDATLFGGMLIASGAVGYLLARFRGRGGEQ